MSLITKLFGNGGKPVKRNVHLRQTYDHDGNPSIEESAEEIFTMSPEGSLDRVTIEHDAVFHCGCNTKNGLGGQCGEPGCGRLSCRRCFTRCAICNKPLCLQHTKEDDSVSGKRIHLCKKCFEGRRRKALTRLLLDPFISFDSDKD